MSLLTEEQLNYLRRWDTPTIANGLEWKELPEKHGQKRTDGLFDPKIQCRFPDMGIINGYAATAVVKASEPQEEGGDYTNRMDYWRYLDSLPKPTILVIHDLDAPNPIGSFWGEVNGSVHTSLGCIGVVTDGGVRDLDEVRTLGFQFYSAEVLVSHAYIHLVEYGNPVEVGGVKVESGDLIQADQHGAIRIPESIATVLGQACYEQFESERALVQFCQTPGVTVDTLIDFVSKK
jgi:4-hydroxy-4-methyl-2-oxoglutarate aldolase